MADWFCGSGTTPVVAYRHGRGFIAADASAEAVQTTAARLDAEGCAISVEGYSSPPIPKSSSEPLSP